MEEKIYKCHDPHNLRRQWFASIILSFKTFAIWGWHFMRTPSQAFTDHRPTQTLNKNLHDISYLLEKLILPFLLAPQNIYPHVWRYLFSVLSIL